MSFALPPPYHALLCLLSPLPPLTVLGTGWMEQYYLNKQTNKQTNRQTDGQDRMRGSDWWWKGQWTVEVVTHACACMLRCDFMHSHLPNLPPSPFLNLNLTPFIYIYVTITITSIIQASGRSREEAVEVWGLCNVDGLCFWIWVGFTCLWPSHYHALCALPVLPCMYVPACCVAVTRLHLSPRLAAACHRTYLPAHTTFTAHIPCFSLPACYYLFAALFACHHHAFCLPPPFAAAPASAPLLPRAPRAHAFAFCLPFLLPLLQQHFCTC